MWPAVARVLPGTENARVRRGLGKDISKDLDDCQGCSHCGLTGSEIENVFADALFKAFEAGKEPTNLTVAGILTEFVRCPSSWRNRGPG